MLMLVKRGLCCGMERNTDIRCVHNVEGDLEHGRSDYRIGRISIDVDLQHPLGVVGLFVPLP